MTFERVMLRPVRTLFFSSFFPSSATSAVTSSLSLFGTSQLMNLFSWYRKGTRVLMISQACIALVRSYWKALKVTVQSFRILSSEKLITCLMLVLIPILMRQVFSSESSSVISLG